jgi:hypothetical protein
MISTIEQAALQLCTAAMRPQEKLVSSVRCLACGVTLTRAGNLARTGRDPRREGFVGSPFFLSSICCTAWIFTANVSSPAFRPLNLVDRVFRWLSPAPA